MAAKGSILKQEVSEKILNACIKYNLKVKYFIKGNIDNEEEYGAFDKVGVYAYGNGDLHLAVNNKAFFQSLNNGYYVLK